jgi:hypothetical protein
VFSYAVTSVRFVLVVVLGASATGKVGNRKGLDELSQTLRSGLRLPMAGVVSRVWVALEALTALGLTVPPTLRYAAILAVIAFGCLTGGAALLVAQHRGFACNCFGARRAELSWLTVVRNSVLSAAAVFVAIAVQSPAGRSTPAPVLLAAVLTVAVGAALCATARPLQALLAHGRPKQPAAPARARESALSGGGRR